jgi:hypothetical protein
MKSLRSLTKIFSILLNIIMAFSVNDNGTWRTVKKLSVYDGAWKAVALNSNTVTWSPQGTTYGSIS